MLRKLAIGIVAVVGALVALLAVAFAAAQTPPAKDKIADVVADKLGGPQRQAEVQGLGGLLPFDIRVGRFALRDDKGVWLEVDKARVKLSPTDLLRGDIHVEDAGAERVAVDHLPPPGPPAPPSSEPFKLPQLPQLPESLPKVQVDRLHLDSVELHQPVLGEAATFSLEGTGGTGPDGKRPALKLALRRTDQPTASLDLDAHLDLAARNLGINLQGQRDRRPDGGPHQAPGRRPAPPLAHGRRAAGRLARPAPGRGRAPGPARRHDRPRLRLDPPRRHRRHLHRRPRRPAAGPRPGRRQRGQAGAPRRRIRRPGCSASTSSCSRPGR